MMIHCRVVTPEGVYKEMDTPIINICSTDGEQGILVNHMPLVTMLKIGHMSTEENGVRQDYAVAGGLFYFRDNEAKILSDAVESRTEIDEERALELKSDTNNFKEPVIRELTEDEVKMLNIFILDFEKETEEIDNIDKTKHSNKKKSNNI